MGVQIEASNSLYKKLFFKPFYYPKFVIPYVFQMQSDGLKL
jgi:hypothetical protein